MCHLLPTRCAPVFRLDVFFAHPEHSGAGSDGCSGRRAWHFGTYWHLPARVGFGEQGEGGNREHSTRVEKRQANKQSLSRR